MNNSVSLLESKLKRHNISFSTENGKIIIGKSKIDYVTIFGLIVLPVLAGISISLLVILSDIDFVVGRGKVTLGILLLFGIGVFNYSRIKSKKHANENKITLDDKTIIIENDFGRIIFDSKNTKNIICHVQQVTEELYEGSIFLVDEEDRQHQIIGFDDENEKYVTNDLKWFINYLNNHIK